MDRPVVPVFLWQKTSWKVLSSCLSVCLSVCRWIDRLSSSYFLYLSTYTYIYIYYTYYLSRLSFFLSFFLPSFLPSFLPASRQRCIYGESKYMNFDRKYTTGRRTDGRMSDESSLVGGYFPSPSIDTLPWMLHLLTVMDTSNVPPLRRATLHILLSFVPYPFCKQTCLL